jgi:hypothetical protein
MAKRLVKAVNLDLSRLSAPINDLATFVTGRCSQASRKRSPQSVDDDDTTSSRPVAKRSQKSSDDVISASDVNRGYESETTDSNSDDDEYDMLQRQATLWIDLSGVDINDIERQVFNDVTSDRPTDNRQIEGVTLPLIMLLSFSHTASKVFVTTVIRTRFDTIRHYLRIIRPKK